MFKRMPQNEARQWQSATTLTELGALMARWLEGDIQSHPAYAPKTGPDKETRPLIPYLAAFNRAGFLTDCSQPGDTTRVRAGHVWEQRAAVQGFVTDRALHNRLHQTATKTGLLIATRDRIPAVTRGGTPYAWFGGHLPPRELANQWAILHPTALQHLCQARQIAILAPDYGTGGQHMWPALAAAAKRH